MVNSDCPETDTLREYLEDRLPPEMASDLTVHIDGCSACQLRLDSLLGGNTAIERIRDRGAKVLQTRVQPLLENDDFEQRITRSLDDLNGISPIPTHNVLPAVPGYTVLEELARGGMGVVYRAIHKRLNRPVAIKMILAGGLVDPRVTQRFLIEAEILGRVRHSQVVQVYEVSLYTASSGVSIPYLAMEYLEGGTLEHWSRGVAQPTGQAAELVEGIARAVHVAHAQGIVHRDLKPANILRSSEGVFKVTDFGIAKLTADSNSGLTGTGTVMGTPAYMAPEQAAGEKGIGPPADVYSLGAILFELLTGQPPFDGSEPMSVLLKVINTLPPEVRSIRRDVPKDLSAIVSKCLAKDPNRRYGSASELADDLARFRQARPTRARLHSTPERMWFWARRNPSVAALLVALLTVVIMSFISVLVLWRRAEANAEEMSQARDAAKRQSEVAEEQRDEASKRRRETDSREAYLTFDRAARLCDGGQLDEGLRGFVRALDLAEKTSDLELARVVRINIAAWERELMPSAKFFRHSESESLVASGFSPDGQWIYTAGTDNRICIWETESGKKLAELTDPDPEHLASRMKNVPILGEALDQPRIRAVAINKDRTLVAATMASGTLSIWKPSQSKPMLSKRVVVRNRGASEIWAATFDLNNYLWLGGDGGLLAQVNSATGETVTSVDVPLGRNPKGEIAPTSVHCLRLSNDGLRLYTGDRAGRLLEWNLDSKTVSRKLREVNGWIYDIDVSQDDRFVANGGTAEASLVPLAGEKSWVVSANGSEPGSIRFTHSGRAVAVGESDGKVQLIDVDTRTPIGSPLRFGRTQVRLAVRPGRDELLIPEQNGVSLNPLPALPSVSVPILDLGYDPRILEFDPGGKTLLVGVGELFLASAETGKKIATVVNWEEALAASFAEKGSRIIYGLRDGWGIHDLSEKKSVRKEKSSRYINQVLACPDKASVCIRLFDRLQGISDKGRLLPSAYPKGIKAQIVPSTACLAPNGSEIRFCIGSELYFFDMVSGEPTRPRFKFRDEVRAMNQSKSGSRIVVGLRDQSVQLLDLKSGKTLFDVPPRHDAAITSVALSPEGETILSGSRDQNARFWDAKTGLVLGPRLRHNDPVTLVAYSPDANSVATGTKHGRIAIWKVPVPTEGNQAPIDVLRSKYQKLDGNSWPRSQTYR